MMEQQPTNQEGTIREEKTAGMIPTRSWKGVLVIGLLLVTLAATLFFVKQQQNTRSKAASDVSQGAFHTQDRDSGADLPYLGSDTYKTETLHVRIKMKDINALLQQ